MEIISRPLRYDTKRRQRRKACLPSTQVCPASTIELAIHTLMKTLEMDGLSFSPKGIAL